MDSKKKIIVSVSAFIVVVMATVVAIVSVLAATNVRMSAGISVTYNVGDNVMLDVCVYTGVVEKNVTAAEFVDVSYTMDDGSIGYGNALDELTLNLPATTITATQYLVVRFEFYNVSAESYFDAELQVTSDSRLTCKYAENPFSGGAGGRPEFQGEVGGCNGSLPPHPSSACCPVSTSAAWSRGFFPPDSQPSSC